MPLIKSTPKSAFEQNIQREREAGRPEKQAVAIAYSTRREAGRHADHSDHIAELGSAYESNSVSTGHQTHSHPVVTASMKPSTKSSKESE